MMELIWSVLPGMAVIFFFTAACMSYADFKKEVDRIAKPPPTKAVWLVRKTMINVVMALLFTFAAILNSAINEVDQTEPPPCEQKKLIIVQAANN